MDIWTVVGLLFVLSVVGVLVIGLGVFTSGGEFNRKHSNRLMRYRIAAQAVAVVGILALIAARAIWGQ